MVHGRGRPHQVDGAEGRPRHAQVRLDGADPAGHTEIAGFVPEVAQHVRGDVQGGRVGSLEALEQGEGTGTGTAAQVEDPARGPIAGHLLEPGGHVGQVGVQYLGVEVQEFGHGGLVCGVR